MGKDFKKQITEGLVEESKSDPVYQGGYTDGYGAGEQYGCIACRNDAFEAAARKVESTLLNSVITKTIAAMLREMKEEAPNG